MKAFLAVLFATISCGTLAATAGADANVGASCQAILSSTDAHAQQRDDVARFFALELRPAFGVPPGVIYREVAAAHDGTYAACAPA